MSNVLTITDLTNTLAEQTGSTKKAAKEQIEAVVGLITAGLVSGDAVRIAGLGTLTVVEREARTGRNPQTGEALEIPASKTVKFKVTSSLKAAVNGEGAE